MVSYDDTAGRCKHGLHRDMRISFSVGYVPESAFCLPQGGLEGFKGENAYGDALYVLRGRAYDVSGEPGDLLSYSVRTDGYRYIRVA